MQLVGFCPAYIFAAGFAVLLAAAIDQLAAGLAQPVHRKGRAGTIAQEPLKACTVVGFNPHPGIHRETAVLVPQYFFYLEVLQQPTAHKTAQDATTQSALHMGYGFGVDIACRVEDDAGYSGFVTGGKTDSIIPRYFLKHPIDDTDVEVNVFIEAGAEAVNEGDCADVQARLVHIGRAKAVRLQALRNDPQKNPQHHVEH